MPNRPVQSNAAAGEARGRKAEGGGQANVRRSPERMDLRGERVEEDLKEESWGGVDLLVTHCSSGGSGGSSSHRDTPCACETALERPGNQRKERWEEEEERVKERGREGDSEVSLNSNTVC